MFHALNEIRRVLVPNGIMVVLRPLAGSWPIEVATTRDFQEAGRVSDSSTGLEDDRAANETMTKA